MTQEELENTDSDKIESLSVILAAIASENDEAKLRGFAVILTDLCRRETSTVLRQRYFTAIRDLVIRLSDISCQTRPIPTFH